MPPVRRLLAAEPLEDRTVPVFVAGYTPVTVSNPLIVTGSGPGGGEVRAYDPDTRDEVFQATPFGPDFTGGVTVATAELTGDATPDVVAGVASGGSEVVVLDGRTGRELRRIAAFEPVFRGGVNVAVGDVTGDGTPDIVVGAGLGGGPVVKVFDGATGALARSFFAYAADFRGGAFVAVGDVTRDGAADLVTGAGPGGGPHVRVFDGKTGGVARSFFAGDPGALTGATVAVPAAPSEGGAAGIVAGPAAGPGPVGLYGTVTTADASADPVVYEERFERVAAYDPFPGFGGGVRVAAAVFGMPSDTGTVIDFVFGAGPGGGPVVGVMSAPPWQVVPDTGAFAGRQFLAGDDGDRGGVYVAAAPRVVRYVPNPPPIFVPPPPPVPDDFGPAVGTPPTPPAGGSPPARPAGPPGATPAG